MVGFFGGVVLMFGFFRLGVWFVGGFYLLFLWKKLDF